MQHQIIAGEKKSAVTLFKMDKGIDTGDILFQKEFSLDGDLNNIYECNAICSANSLLAGTSFSQDIMLYEGWNLWSTYIDPDDNSMEAVFTNIEENITFQVEKKKSDK